MSIQIITEAGRSRPTFTCDKCGQPIQPEEGMLLWDPKNEGPRVHDTVLVCRRCDIDEQLFSQELDTGLIYLLICAGWLDEDWKPTAKLLAAAKNAMLLSRF
jgi:hypothetical protein